MFQIEERESIHDFKLMLELVSHSKQRIQGQTKTDGSPSHNIKYREKFKMIVLVKRTIK